MPKRKNQPLQAGGVFLILLSLLAVFPKSICDVIKDNFEKCPHSPPSLMLM